MLKMIKYIFTLQYRDVETKFGTFAHFVQDVAPVALHRPPDCPEDRMKRQG